MRLNILLSLITLQLLSFFSKVSAQVDYTIGTGTSTNSNTSYPSPYGDRYEGTRAQYLYKASELAALGMTAGNISAIKWNVTALNSTDVHENWQVKIGTTTATALSTWQTGLTTVVSATNYTPVLGINTHTFSAPFFWNGTDNVVVEICHGDPGNNTGIWYSYNASVAYTVMSYNASLTYRADNNGNGCGITTTSTGTNPTYRPNIVFVHTPTTACTTPPAVGSTIVSATSLCSSAPLSITINGHSHRVGQTYQLQSANSLAGPYSNVNAPAGYWAQAINPIVTTSGTVYYRTAVTCGTSTSYSTPASVSLTPQLAAGTYTIDPAQPASATNFTSFSSVASALGCGIAGNVIFNIASGIYTERVTIPQLLGASAGSRLTFQSATGNPADVTIQFATTSTNNFVVKLDGAKYISFKNLTLKSTGTSTYGRVIEIAGDASYDSVVNCKITGIVSTTTSNTAALIYAPDLTVNNVQNVFKSNILENGSYGAYWYSSTSSSTDNNVFDSNTFTNQYYYSFYAYGTTNTKFRNNTVTASNTNSTFYAPYFYYCDDALEVVNNKITVNSTGSVYGLRIYYCDGTAAQPGLIKNNVISISAATNYGSLYSYYSSYQNYYNNTVYSNSTGATNYAAYFNHTSATYSNINIRNNIFYNNGTTGYAMYFAANPQYVNSDYNNIYAKSGNPFYYSTAVSTLQAWRTARAQELNSISYYPGFTSATNLAPNPADSSSWSVNGRGIHLTGNNTDINGNARATALATGVPDLGAYEFAPTALPPMAEAIPASPAQGVTQYFLFGQDTVAAVAWSGTSNIPTSMSVRQYSGTTGPQFLSTSPGSYMYFYTDIDMPAGTYDFAANVYYKKPWLGTIANEASLKMVRKLGNTGKWIPYNSGGSSTDVARSIITANVANNGYFTGIDDDVLFLALIYPGKRVMCPGGNITLEANQGPGITYKWLLNGSYLPGATSYTYNATAIGTYEVEETRNGAIVTSESTTINQINPPVAVVSTVGNPVICTGGKIMLDANTGTDLTYQWKLNGTNIPTATNASYEANAVGQYSVEITNPGCSTTSSGFTITSEPLPMATISPDTTVLLCPGAATTLNATVPPTNVNDIEYQWRNNGIDIPGATNAAYVTSAPGNYTLVLSASTCPVTISAGTNVMQVQVPAPTISVNGLTLTTGSNYTSYQWYKNGTAIPGANSFYYNVHENGIYSVSVSNGGCDGLSEDVTVSTVGVTDIDAIKNNIRVYPNPASSTITIAAPMPVNVILIGADGRTVLQQKAVSTCDISSLADGVYMMKILDKENSLITTQRLIKSSKY